MVAMQAAGVVNNPGCPYKVSRQCGACGVLALIRTGTRGSRWLPGDPSHDAGVVWVMLPIYLQKIIWFPCAGVYRTEG